MKFDYSFKSGFVIGYVVFSTAVAIFFTSYCVPCIYMGERGKKITISEMMMLMVKRKHKITDDDQAGSSSTVGLSEEGIKEISMLEKRVTRMRYAYLKDATDNFSENNVIGQGKMGMLYKAALPNGCVLAVKKLHDSQFLEKQFISELKILGSLRHINVLPLLGFCVESNQRFLVYKYMPNGNLYDWLHPMEEGQEKAMEWGVRMITGMDPSNMTASSNNVLNELTSSSDFHGAVDKSLIGKGFDAEIIQLLKVACACVDPIPDRRPIMVQVYEDIKAIRKRCDLVDESSMLTQPEICPATPEKSISNFGRAMHRRSNDKSLIASSKIGEVELIKQDVYQFGILLLELIAVHDPDHNSESSHTLEENLFERIAHLSSSSYSLYHAVDKSLLGQGFDATFTVTSATETDVYCMKSIKDSMIDPHGYLNTTWNFNNNTEGFICRFLGVDCWHPDENRVLNIRLSELGLKGEFPLGLENCTSLNHFHVGEEGYKNELRRS
ncbi:inactive leucine-rich repeat receptor-like protein kinase [Populus alba x Populus x berolinensis]|nr:inactive leucine-rich repeat receptor-like protein kinase [Populus alba x Populus x berolinensis]